MRWPAWWLRFTDWTKLKPWRYRTVVAIALSTVFPVCFVIGVVMGVVSGCQNFANGVRAFIAGEPT